MGKLSFLEPLFQLPLVSHQQDKLYIALAYDPVGIQVGIQAGLPSICVIELSLSYVKDESTNENDNHSLLPAPCNNLNLELLFLRRPKLPPFVLLRGCHKKLTSIPVYFPAECHSALVPSLNPNLPRKNC